MLTAIEKLDRIIHEPGRLWIMTLLAATESLGFKELKAQLGMTDGNLCVHMRTLEESGYVSVHKSFVNRKPRTEYSLTPVGRQAFDAYIQTLKEIVEQSQPTPPTPPAVHAQPVGAREVRPALQKGMAPAK
jgi:DNA-binding HxlR family transcriptional regulator